VLPTELETLPKTQLRCKGREERRNSKIEERASFASRRVQKKVAQRRPHSFASLPAHLLLDLLCSVVRETVLRLRETQGPQIDRRDSPRSTTKDRLVHAQLRHLASPAHPYQKETTLACLLSAGARPPSNP
jgi:hypothetical protein